MVRLYTCDPCRAGRHKHCERSSSVPPGTYGGSHCICPCRGDPNWRAREEREARELAERILKFKAR